MVTFSLRHVFSLAGLWGQHTRLLFHSWRHVAPTSAHAQAFTGQLVLAVGQGICVSSWVSAKSISLLLEICSPWDSSMAQAGNGSFSCGLLKWGTLWTPWLRGLAYRIWVLSSEVRSNPYVLLACCAVLPWVLRQQISHELKLLKPWAQTNILFKFTISSIFL